MEHSNHMAAKAKEELVGMGFSEELASRALAATGGSSTHMAAEWILNHNDSPHHHTHETQTEPSPSTPTTPTHIPIPTAATNNPTTASPGSTVQPKLDRYFVTCPKSKPCSSKSQLPYSSSSSAVAGGVGGGQEPFQSLSPNKRAKLSTPMPPPSVSGQLQQLQPLAERMRPRTVSEVVGQDHLLGPNSMLRSAIDCNRLPSLVLWGPPGTGKTSLARAIVDSTPRSSSSSCTTATAVTAYRFVSLSSVTAGVKDVRDVVAEARKSKSSSSKQQQQQGHHHMTVTVLFVDEVHRFNKSQQDSFLPIIEDGTVVFIGATTENPSFHLITPLLSRCRVLVLNPLQPSHVTHLLTRAASDPHRGLSRSIVIAPDNNAPIGGEGIQIHVAQEAIAFISSNCDGDARVALNALEISATTALARLKLLQPMGMDSQDAAVGVVAITLEDAKEALQSKHLSYDKAGEEHFNLISALIKSMRGSDTDASIYWLVRMLQGGEQPLYIARRLIHFASEDVGLADPSALAQAVACYQACHFIGVPECNVNLAQCVAYLALAPKSVAVYQAMLAAQEVVKESVGQNEGVPLHLRNAPTKLMKEVGYGKRYIYTPDNPSASQSFLPPSLQGYKFLHWPN